MKLRHILSSVGWGLLALCADAMASEVSLQPTGYSGPRSGAAYLQSYFGTVYESRGANAFLSLHYESEMIGTRHDFTFDVDRAYVRSGEFYFGRVHVWDLTAFEARDDLWGLLAQFQPINLGIQLNPILIAPLGVHYAHESGDDSIAVSVAPLAVPSLGSEVSLNENSVSANRFGRLPPGSVIVSGSTLPIRYQIDAGNMFTDVLLKPNLAAVWLHRFSSAYRLAMGGSYAPDPNPTADVASSFVRVATDDVTAVAVVRPHFPYRAMGYVSNQFRTPGREWRLELNALARDDTQGFEASAHYLDHAFVAFSHAWGVSSYLDHLLRVGAETALASKWKAEAELKTELTQAGSVWISSAIHYRPVQTELDFTLGGDLFGGENGTYFGEWRTNDRLWGKLAIRF